MGRARNTAIARVVALVGALAFCLQGYDQAVANGLLTLPAFLAVFPELDVAHAAAGDGARRASVQGTAVAVYEAGCALGALSCVYLGDRLGRRRTVFAAACVVVVGAVVQATPFALGQFIAGRIVAGLGVGGLTATAPMYVAEVSSAASRGRLVLLQGWFAIGGVALASWLSFGLYYARDSAVSWRFPIAFQAVFALAVVSCALVLPESPRWLVGRDRVGDAARALARLEGAPHDSAHVAAAVAAIRLAMHSDDGAAAAAGPAARSPFSMTETRNLHRTALAVGANVLAQMTGVNIITFYSDTILEDALGYSGTVARVISGCLQVWQFLAAGLAVLLVDRFGRRALLVSAAAGMAVAQACLAGLSSDLDNKAAAGASLLFYFVALFCFPIGLFLVPFMYAAEIAPLRTRAKVAAMSAAANWLFNFLLAEVTPLGFATLAWRYYIIYACISAFAALAFHLLYPETRGRTLEEIDDIFVRSRSVLDPVRIARALPPQADMAGAAAADDHGDAEMAAEEPLRDGDKGK